MTVSFKIIIVSLLFFGCFPSKKNNVSSTLKIASTSLVSDEIILDLIEGQDQSFVVALSYLVDDRRYSNVLEKAKMVPFRVGKNPEVFLDKKINTVIMASFNNPSLKNQILSLGIKSVYIKEINSFENLILNYKIIAKVIGLEKESENYIKTLESKINLFKKKHIIPDSEKRTIFLLEDGSSPGKYTIFDDIATHSGLINSVPTKGWSRLSQETIIELDPSWVVVPVLDTSIRSIKKIKESYKKRFFVKESKIITVPSSLVFSGSSHVFKAVDIIRKKITKKHKIL